MIKVNQITSPAQAARLRGRADLGGICVSREDGARAPYLGVDAAVTLREQVPDLPLSVTVRPGEPFTASELSELLDALDAAFLEFTPVDFAKAGEFQEQLAELAVLERPKIANGFFIQQDDCGFIRETEPYDRLREIGVELFQFEVESAVDERFRIRSGDLAAAEAFFRRVPTLVTDAIESTDGYPLASVAGFFFNIAAPLEAPNYDYSRRSFPESRIARILRYGSPS
jgi:hypothetical protein